MMMIVICKHILLYKPKGLCQRANAQSQICCHVRYSVALSAIKKMNMKNIILISLTCIALYSCQNGEIGSGKSNAKKSYSEIVTEQLALNSKNDTTFLNFVFGATKQNVKKQCPACAKWQLRWSNVVGITQLILFSSNPVRPRQFPPEFLP